MIYGAETRIRYTKRGIQNSKKGSYKKAIVKVSEEIELTSSQIYNYACKKIKTGYTITKI